MYLYVELWNVTQKWMDLSIEERRDFFNNLGPEIQKLMDQGVEVTGWALNDEHTPYRSDYRYMAVWKVPTLDLVEALESSVSDAGWHDYFTQVNSRGQIIPFNKAIENLINLENTTSYNA